MHLTVHDPEWLQEDITAALEWVAYEHTICSGCGHSKLETMDPANEKRWYVETVRCHACKEIQHEAKKLQKDENADSAGMYFIAGFDDEPEEGDDW